MSENKLPDWAIEQLKEQEFSRSQLSVTMLDYQEAIRRLIRIATSDTGGAAAAAQVLLSVYNDRNWQLNVMDLGRLDAKNILDSLTVIRGWLSLSEYPHNVIENGRAIFSQLEDRWQSLHVENRYSNIYRNK